MKKKMARLLTAVAIIFLMSGIAKVDVSAATQYSYRGVKWSIDISNGLLTISPGVASGDYAKGDMGTSIQSYEAWRSRSGEVEKIVIEEGVTRIADNAFASMANLKEVTIADSVKTIGNSVFKSDAALVSVDLGEGVETIGEYAFSLCTALKEVTTPASLDSVGQYVFNGCSALEKAVLTDGLEEIGQYAFKNCTKLSDISMSSTIRSVGKAAFESTAFVSAQSQNEIIICDNLVIGTNLTSFKEGNPCVIPEGITCITDHAFNGIEIYELELPESLRYIGKYSFSGKSYNTHDKRVENLDLKNVVSIDNGAFQYWHYIKSVDLSKVKYLGGNGFYWCNGLTTVEMAYKMDFIGEYAFSACKNLADIRVPLEVKSVDTTSFTCKGPVKDKIYYDDNGDGIYYHEGMLLQAIAADGIDYAGQIIVEDGTYNIANRAFMQFSPAEPITSMIIPKSVKYIGDMNLRSLTDVYYEGTESAWKAIYSDNPSQFQNVTIHYGENDIIEAKDVTAKLSYSKTTYNGEQKTPKVTVTDLNGRTLVKDTDYTITYDKATRKNVGRYKVTVNLMQNYSGTKELWFTILPKETSTVKVTLVALSNAYDDVRVKWDKVTGASGYELSYKKSSSDTWIKTIDCGTTRDKVLNNLSDGVKYDVKITAYYKTNGTKYRALKSKTSNIWTLKKVTGLKVKKYNASKVKASWTNINGETGYQIRRQTKNGNAYVTQKTYTTSSSSLLIAPTKGKKYYYQVRAYKTVDGKKVYAPWSARVSYTLPK